MTATPAGTDRERLEDVAHVLHGPEGSGRWTNLLYVLYVVALLTGIYGFTVLRGVVSVLDLPARGWRLGPTDPAGAVVLASLAGLVVVVVTLAHLAGRRRGPVTPALPWLDHVAAAPIDRALVLRDAWRLPATGVVAACTLVGAVLGAAVWGGGAAGPGAAGVGLGVGVLGSAAVVTAWLAGQVAADPASPSAVGPALRRCLRPALALRDLGLEGLRAHSARSSRLGGAALAGDPRAARLEAAAPVRRGRTHRLRSRGPVRTVVARDLLGLRRQPVLPAGGALLSLVGGAGLGAVSGARPGNLVPAMLVAIALHLAAGVVAEGLRLHGDTLGAPRLLGGSVVREGLAHSVVPALLLAGTALPAALVVAGLVGDGAAVGSTAAAFVAVGGVVLAAQWLGAFRVLPPTLAFVPETGPAVLVVWLLVPPVTSAVVGALAVRLVLTALNGAPLTAVSAVLVVAGTWWRALRALRSASGAHRD